MLAILIYDPDQLLWNQVPAAVLAWVRDAGGLAAVALLIWTVAYLVQRPPGASERWSFQSRLFVLALAGAAIMYGLFFAFLRIEGMISKPLVINGKEVVYNGKEIKVSEFTPRQVW